MEVLEIKDVMVIGVHATALLQIIVNADYSSGWREHWTFHLGRPPRRFGVYRLGLVKEKFDINIPFTYHCPPYRRLVS